MLWHLLLVPLSPAERNYGVTEVATLAIVWDIKEFTHYLTDTRFVVVVFTCLLKRITR